jgi:predicted acetyltransferase
MNNSIKKQVKDLWKLCFDDSDEFIELYFNLRFNMQVNSWIDSGNQVIAALQRLPYTLNYYGEELGASYISGACTHPEYRNKGVMRRLIAESFALMSLQSVTFCTLIPAEDWLYDYYGKLGFAPVFHYSMQDMLDGPTKKSSSKIEKVTEFRPEIYKYFDIKMHKRDCCIQHSEADFKVIIEDMKIDKGLVLAALREGNVVGLAFVYREEDILYIAELLYDTNKVRQELIEAVKELDEKASVKLIAPVTEGEEAIRHGMIRIINVPKTLQIFAIHHPNLVMNITIEDPMLSSNNNYYYLYKGKCMVSKEKLPGRHVAFTMSQLAEFVFEDLHPFMSLMMD